jgi:hypothetical protein
MQRWYPFAWHFVPAELCAFAHGVGDSSVEDLVAALRLLSQQPEWATTQKVLLDFRQIRALRSEADVEQFVSRLELYDFLEERSTAIVVYPGQQTGIARMVLFKVGVLAHVRVFHDWYPALVWLGLAPA